MNATPRQRPQSVTLAVLLLVLVMIVGIVSSFYQMSHNAQLQSMSDQMPAMKSIMFVVMLAIYGLEFFFIYMIYQGKNWARITMLVLFILGLLASIPGYLGMGHVQVASSVRIMSAAVQLVSFIAYVMLFSGQSSDWFKNRID